MFRMSKKLLEEKGRYAVLFISYYQMTIGACEC